MATITAFTSSGRSDSMMTFVSDRAAVADTVDMDGIDPSFTHCFLAVQLLDVNGDPVLGGAGTLAVTVYTLNNNQGEAPAVSSIDATAPVTVDWASNTVRVKVVPTGVTTAINYQVVVTCNKS